jgi:prolyl-tRNA synthetase
MEQTYSRIFERLGLDYRIVEADSGAIGGSGSKEFMVIADSGEDTIVVCDSCEYGANIEAARRAPLKASAEEPEISMSSKFRTEGIKTIEDLSRFFHVDPYYLVKTVAMKALYDEGVTKIVLFALRGSDTLEETKACNAAGANELVDVTPEELSAAGLVAGFMGPVNLPEGITIVFDEGLQEGKSLICGANEVDFHYVGYDLRGVEMVYHDLIAVQAGDSCPRCSGTLKHTKGIEVGHIFQLGTQYSEPLKAEFLDENGKSKPFVMGTYGIGISRLLAAIIEQHHDDRGCIWTKESAPFAVQIIISNIKKDEEREAGEKLYASLKAAGVEVLLDDRKERFGFKMKDFELIGIPLAVVIGKNLSEGKVEIVTREGLVKELVDSHEILTEVQRRL